MSAKRRSTCNHWLCGAVFLVAMATNLACGPAVHKMHDSAPPEVVGIVAIRPPLQVRSVDAQEMPRGGRLYSGDSHHVELERGLHSLLVYHSELALRGALPVPTAANVTSDVQVRFAVQGKRSYRLAERVLGAMWWAWVEDQSGTPPAGIARDSYRPRRFTIPGHADLELVVTDDWQDASRDGGPNALRILRIIPISPVSEPDAEILISILRDDQPGSQAQSPDELRRLVESLSRRRRGQPAVQIHDLGSTSVPGFYYADSPAEPSAEPLHVHHGVARVGNLVLVFTISNRPAAADTLPLAMQMLRGARQVKSTNGTTDQLLKRTGALPKAERSGCALRSTGYRY